MNNNMTKLMVVAGAIFTACCLMAAPGAGAPPHGGQPPHNKGAVRSAPKGGVHHGEKHMPAKPAAHAPAKPHAAPAKPVAHAPAKHHKHPANARHWARPAKLPPRHHGAKRAWEWVATAWNMTIDGVYYYGDGYYYDGYNYYYNGAYYTTPPVVVAQPAVVVPQPPPPPPRRRGFWDWLFGD